MNKVVFITGASRGIGLATAKKFADNGWKVAGFSNKTEGYYQVDVTDWPNIQKVFDKAFADMGQVDCLVNCAGIVTPKPFLEITEELFLKELQVNTLGSFRACQVVVPLMKNGGSIVNISSIRGLVNTATERGIPYSVSKAGIVAMTAALAKELAPKIRVNAIAPGFTETDMAKSWNEKVWSQVKQALLERPAQPEDIAKAIYFLGSEESSFVTGQTLLVDGGYSMGGK